MLVGLVGLSVLLVLYLFQAISSGLVLAGLGLAALVGYLADRGGHDALLPPAGLLLGLGAGLTVGDLARDVPLGWAGEAGLFGLALLGVYWAERRHTWAVAFGGLLLLVALATAIWGLLPDPWLTSLGLLAVLAGGSAAVGFWRLRWPAPAPVAAVTNVIHPGSR